ncbi:integral membrane protein [Streptococcus pneumoniae]|nr:integral membrane protein [Streptococcus pneumoniae]
MKLKTLALISGIVGLVGGILLLIPNIKFLFYLTTVSLLSFSLILVEYKKSYLANF